MRILTSSWGYVVRGVSLALLISGCSGLDLNRQSPYDVRAEREYTIQVASMQLHDKADQLVGHLMGLGYPAWLQNSKIYSGWYHVCVGRFGQSAEAQPAVMSLRSAGFADSFIRPVDPLDS